MKKIAIIGSGKWGARVLQTVSQMKDCRVVAVVDRNPAHQADARRIVPQAKILASVADLEAKDPLDLAYVCTQASSHFEVLKDFAERGVDCLVEKPFCSNLAQAEDIAERFQKRSLRLVVGHVLLHSDGFSTFKDEIEKTGLGQSRFVYRSQRMDLGSFPKDVNIFEHLLYHDLYLVDELFGLGNVEIDWAKEAKHEFIGAVTGFISLRTKIDASHFLLEASQIHSSRVRRVEISSDQGSLVWEDYPEEFSVSFTPFEISSDNQLVQFKRSETRNHRQRNGVSSLERQISHALDGRTSTRSLEQAFRVKRFLEEMRS